MTGTRQLPPVCRLSSARELTLLERALPFRELSLLAEADRRSIDPIYAAHRWWARRPPALMRGLLLATALPADCPDSKFWEAFATPTHPLAGMRVHDPLGSGGLALV